MIEVEWRLSSVRFFAFGRDLSSSRNGVRLECGYRPAVRGGVASVGMREEGSIVRGVASSVRGYCTCDVALLSATGRSQLVAVADPELLHGPVQMRLDCPHREV
jgi:hypothetical protein